MIAINLYDGEQITFSDQTAMINFFAIQHNRDEHIGVIGTEKEVSRIALDRENLLEIRKAELKRQYRKGR